MSYKDNNPYSNFKGRDYNYPKLSSTNNFSIDQFFKIISSGDVTKLDTFLSSYPQSINVLNSNGESAYHVIVESNLSTIEKISLIKYLNSKGTILNVQNKNGDTPLLTASKRFDLDVVKTLIELGSDLNIYNNQNITPAHLIFYGNSGQCNDLEIQQIITDPTPKIDKVKVSESFNILKKMFLENQLDNRDLLANINDNIFRSVLEQLFESTKYKSLFDRISENLFQNIKNVVKDTFKTDSEKKSSILDEYNKSVKDVLKLLKNYDSKFDEEIDFTPSINLDQTGFSVSDIQNFTPTPTDNYFLIDYRPDLETLINNYRRENGNCDQKEEELKQFYLEFKKAVESTLIECIKINRSKLFYERQFEQLNLFEIYNTLDQVGGSSSTSIPTPTPTGFRLSFRPNVINYKSNNSRTTLRNIKIPIKSTIFRMKFESETLKTFFLSNEIYENNQNKNQVNIGGLYSIKKSKINEFNKFFYNPDNLDNGNEEYDFLNFVREIKLNIKGYNEVIERVKNGINRLTDKSFFNVKKEVRRIKEEYFKGPFFDIPAVSGSSTPTPTPTPTPAPGGPGSGSGPSSGSGSGSGNAGRGSAGRGGRGRGGRGGRGRGGRGGRFFLGRGNVGRGNVGRGNGSGSSTSTSSLNPNAVSFIQPPVIQPPVPGNARLKTSSGGGSGPSGGRGNAGRGTGSTSSSPQIAARIYKSYRKVTVQSDLNIIFKRITKIDNQTSQPTPLPIPSPPTPYDQINISELEDEFFYYILFKNQDNIRTQNNTSPSGRGQSGGSSSAGRNPGRGSTNVRFSPDDTLENVFKFLNNKFGVSFIDDNAYIRDIDVNFGNEGKLSFGINYLRNSVPKKVDLTEDYYTILTGQNNDINLINGEVIFKELNDRQINDIFVLSCIRKDPNNNFYLKRISNDPNGNPLAFDRENNSAGGVINLLVNPYNAFRVTQNGMDQLGRSVQLNAGDGKIYENHLLGETDSNYDHIRRLFNVEPFWNFEISRFFTEPQPSPFVPTPPTPLSKINEYYKFQSYNGLDQKEDEVSNIIRQIISRNSPKIVISSPTPTPTLYNVNFEFRFYNLLFNNSNANTGLYYLPEEGNIDINEDILRARGEGKFDHLKYLVQSGGDVDEVVLNLNELFGLVNTTLVYLRDSIENIRNAEIAYGYSITNEILKNNLDIIYDRFENLLKELITNIMDDEDDIGNYSLVNLRKYFNNYIDCLKIIRTYENLENLFGMTTTLVKTNYEIMENKFNEMSNYLRQELNLEDLENMQIPSLNVDNNSENRLLYVDRIPNLLFILRYEYIKDFIITNHNNFVRYGLIDNISQMIINDVEGNISQEKLLPTVYSIIGDYMDFILKDLLTNNIKNLLKEMAKRNNEYITPSPTPLSINSFNNYNLIDLDTNFGLDISKSDEDIYNYITRSRNFPYEIASFGSILTRNKVKNVRGYKNESNIQLFYPQDFILSTRSPKMCTKYDSALIEKLIESNIDFNFKDLDGNNIIHYSINSQNYLAIEKLRDTLDNDIYKRLIEAENNEGKSSYQFCNDKLNKIRSYFLDSQLNNMAKMSSYFEDNLYKKVEEISYHRNVLDNYDLVPYLMLYLNHYGSVVINVDNPTIGLYNYTDQVVATPISTPTPFEMRLEKFNIMKPKYIFQKIRDIKDENQSDNLLPDEASQNVKFQQINRLMLDSRHLNKNNDLRQEFEKVCFVIDLIVGNSFYKVLKRLLFTFFKNKYQSGDTSNVNYIDFLNQKLNDKLNKIRSYITYDISLESNVGEINLFTGYQPSEFTKKFVSINGNYKLDEYQDEDIDSLFTYVFNIFMNHGELINNDNPIKSHLDRVIRNYFKSYYNESINICQNCIQSYNNYISSFIIHNQMLELLN